MFYLKVPVLAYRNFLSDYRDSEWPLCWDNRRRITTALRLTVDILKPWLAFRRPGGSERALKRLEPKFPRIVRRLQHSFRKQKVKCVSAISAGGIRYNAVVRQMGRAVNEISKLVPIQNPNPMLASKVLSFFFPDFFPVWDSAWVGKALKCYESNTELTARIKKALPEGSAGLAYALYVDLMIRDSAEISDGEYGALRSQLIRVCTKAGYYKPSYVLDEFFGDLTPVLFEACLLGRAARNGHL